MKYKLSWTATKLGFFGDTVVPGAEIIEATDIENAWEIAKKLAKSCSREGSLMFTLNDVQLLQEKT